MMWSLEGTASNVDDFHTGKTDRDLQTGGRVGKAFQGRSLESGNDKVRYSVLPGD